MKLKLIILSMILIMLTGCHQTETVDYNNLKFYGDYLEGKENYVYYKGDYDSLSGLYKYIIAKDNEPEDTEIDKVVLLKVNEYGRYDKIYDFGYNNKDNMEEYLLIYKDKLYRHGVVYDLNALDIETSKTSININIPSNFITQGYFKVDDEKIYVSGNMEDREGSVHLICPLNGNPCYEE